MLDMPRTRILIGFTIYNFSLNFSQMSSVYFIFAGLTLTKWAVTCGKGRNTVAVTTLNNMINPKLKNLPKATTLLSLAGSG